MKYQIRRYYDTNIYTEVEADNIEEAIEKAKNNIDAMDDEEYIDNIISNLYSNSIEVTDEKGNNSFHPL